MLETISNEVRNSIMQRFIKKLYDPGKLSIKNQINALFFKSLTMTGTAANGRIHMSTPLGNINKNLGTNIAHYYVDLHPDLEKEIKLIKSSELELNNELNNTKGYFRRGFNLLETMGDIPLVFPETLHPFINSAYQTAVYNSASVLNKHAIEKFNREEQHNINKVKERILTNLLLGG